MIDINLDDVGEAVVRANLARLREYLNSAFDAEGTETGTRAVANCYLLLVRALQATPSADLLYPGYRSVYALALDCADSMNATAQRTELYGQIKRHLEGTV